jgi:hypothetical protein
MEPITERSDMFENVTTCNEMWIFQYDPDMKRQLMHLKAPTSPRMKKARMRKSKVKALMMVFIDIRGVIMIEWVPEGQTVNKKYYFGGPDQAPGTSEEEKS